MRITAINIKKPLGIFDKAKVYIISVAIALGVGILSALITMGDMDIYSEIIKPPLAPPTILFPIVWTLLYILMGISSAMIYLKKAEFSKASQDALFTYAGSLVVNFAWSIIFFKMKAFLLAFVWLILLIAFIIKTIVLYKKIYSVAAYLQIPYAVWVAFAGYLNLAIYILNQ